MTALPASDTIAAIATPPGTGGIGIIRISGPLALAILRALFKPSRPHPFFKSHTLYYGTVSDRDGTVLDEVLAVYMQAPRTYTREDVVEVHSHGSYLVLQAILAQVLHHGARIAEPGEFTKRAFLAGRIDLTQAEAVIDLLRAQTDTGRQLAVGQMQGRLLQRIEGIRQGLIAIMVVLEVAIDFPDDDVEIIDKGRLLAQLQDQVEDRLVELIKMARQGKIIREGVNVVIAGLPNVGKSSLLNALLREDRALVAPVPGTTRDTVEEIISIGGIPARLVDTAGIRDAAGSVEELGIQRARQKVRDADLVLFLLDAARPLTAQDLDLYESLGEADRLVVLNKMDIADRGQTATLMEAFPGVRPVMISARRHQGLAGLEAAIYKKIAGEQVLHERNPCAPNVRHQAVLEKVLAACRRIHEALEAGVTADLVAVEVLAALDDLGDIVGLTTPDEVLDKIFADFCIGK